MNNYLENGAVLPSGLLSDNHMAMLDGFNKSYKNVALRVGVVVQVYPISDSKNRTKLTNEYDVAVMEQNEDRGATLILYRNCLSTDGFGSIADFFDRTIRKQKKKSTKGDSTNLSGQNGAIALILCLDGMSDKGIIIGFLGHPDRKTKIKDEGPYLESEFNGVNFKIEKEGNFTLTFKGATDNDGKALDAEQGQTTAKIEKDGSFEINHKNSKFRIDKKGEVSVVTKLDVKVETEGNVDIKAKGNVVANTEEGEITANCKMAKITAKDEATVESKNIKLGEQAVEAVILGDSFKAFFDSHIHTGNLGAPTSNPVAPMPPNLLSKKVKTE